MRIRATTLIALFALGSAAGCDEPRSRPADLPPGPYAQAEEIPDRYEQSGSEKPVYVIESVLDDRVVLVPAGQPRVLQPARQGDPVHEFVLSKSQFREKAGIAPVVGSRVELYMGSTGQPERIVVLEAE